MLYDRCCRCDISEGQTCSCVKTRRVFNKMLYLYHGAEQTETQLLVLTFSRSNETNRLIQTYCDHSPVSPRG